jgi:hypothetical protein
MPTDLAASILRVVHCVATQYHNPEDHDLNFNHYENRGVKLITHLLLVPSSRMCGTIPLSSQYIMLWCLIKQEVCLHDLVLS